MYWTLKIPFKRWQIIKNSLHTDFGCQHTSILYQGGVTGILPHLWKQGHLKDTFKQSFDTQFNCKSYIPFRNSAVVSTSSWEQNLLSLPITELSFIIHGLAPLSNNCLTRLRFPHWTAINRLPSRIEVPPENLQSL